MSETQSQPSLEELRSAYEKLKHKRAWANAYMKAKRQTEEGLEAQKTASRTYYWNHREEILERNRKRREAQAKVCQIQD
jgi:hypothetical protein